MGKKLAIKGHQTRGKEVIELLEMMGGNNKYLYDGSDGFVYFIEKNDKYITFCGKECIKNTGEYIIYELEEFLEKYPYKVGDKVVYTKYGDNCDDYPVTIDSMKWTGTTIEYTFDDYVTCLSKDLKMWNGVHNTVISGIYLNSCDYADEVELNLGNYEIEVRDGRTYAVNKKSKYPKTYDECYDEYNTEFHFIYVDKDERDLYESFIRLIRCRNAYWKIAGEQMGLGKPWESPLPSLFEIVYCIRRKNNEIIKGSYRGGKSEILEFPTEEMRDAFYENFKDLIEQCKELL